MSLYGIIRGLWWLMPVWLRKMISASTVVLALKERMKRSLLLSADYDEIYDATFYKGIDKWECRSYAIIADSIVKDIQPRSVLDVGCGTGALMMELLSREVRAVKGVEYSEEALRICREKSLDVQKMNLCAALKLPCDAVDLVVCFEVAEHLPEQFSSHLVHLLCKASGRVAFTAATPGQGGASHLNEQENAYWIQKFSDYGYLLDEDTTRRWRKVWKQKDTLVCYYANVMFFRQGRRTD